MRARTAEAHEEYVRFDAARPCRCDDGNYSGSQVHLLRTTQVLDRLISRVGVPEIGCFCVSQGMLGKLGNSLQANARTTARREDAHVTLAKLVIQFHVQ
jgi:hypothetical protein